MSAICGILQLDGAPVDRAALEQMVAGSPYRGPDGIGYWYGGQIGLAHLAFHVTPESVRERQPLRSADGRLVLAADVRLDNRAELIDALRDLPEDPTDPDLLLAAYQRWGTRCVEHLLGDFVFALWDTAARELLLARDQLGAFSLTIHRSGQRLLFASETTAILNAPGVEPRVNETAVTKQLAWVPLDAEETYFEAVHFLPPAHCMSVSGGRTRRWRFWDVDPSARIHYRDDDAYAEHLLHLLTEAVACRTRSIGPVGISLSGGCDSTLLAAVAAPLLQERSSPARRLKSFSYVFDKFPSCDERAAIDEVVRHCDLDQTWLTADDCLTYRNFDAWPLAPDVFSYNFYVALVVRVAEAAQQAGCRVLMGGYYGDALFIGPSYIAADRLREGRVLAALAWLKDHADIGHLKRELIDQLLRPLLPPRVKAVYRRILRRPLQPAIPGIAVGRLRALQAALRAQRPEPEPAGLLPTQRRLRGLLLHPIWGADFASARAMTANRFGLERVSPYLDRRLVEFVMAIPSERLNRPGWERGLQRHAMRRVLPESVSRRQKHQDYAPLLANGLAEACQGVVPRLARDARILSGGWVIPECFEAQLAAGAHTPDQGRALSVFLHLERWLRALEGAQGEAG